MNDVTLKEFLKVNFFSFTKEEIENIMEEELEKDPEEMDTELIDMCLDILTGESENRAGEVLTDSSAVSEKKVKIFNFKKGLLVAAIIVLLITIAIPVGADVLNIDVPESILKVYEEYFRLDTEGKATADDLDTLLAKNDLHDIVLPRFLFLDCEITYFEKINDGFKEQVSFDYFDKKQGTSGKVTLNMYEESEEIFEREMLINNQYKEVKRITSNGIEVIVFSEGQEIYIVYLKNGIDYNIMLHGSTIEKAVEIASTL